MFLRRPTQHETNYPSLTISNRRKDMPTNNLSQDGCSLTKHIKHLTGCMRAISVVKSTLVMLFMMLATTQAEGQTAHVTPGGPLSMRRRLTTDEEQKEINMEIVEEYYSFLGVDDADELAKKHKMTLLGEHKDDRSIWYSKNGDDGETFYFRIVSNKNGEFETTGKVPPTGYFTLGDRYDRDIFYTQKPYCLYCQGEVEENTNTATCPHCRAKGEHGGSWKNNTVGELRLVDWRGVDCLTRRTYKAERFPTRRRLTNHRLIERMLRDEKRVQSIRRRRLAPGDITVSGATFKRHAHTGLLQINGVYSKMTSTKGDKPWYQRKCKDVDEIYSIEFDTTENRWVLRDEHTIYYHSSGQNCVFQKSG